VSGRRRKKADSAPGGAWYEANWLSGLFLLALAAYLGLSLSAGVAPWWQMLEGGEAVELLEQPNPGGPVGAAATLALNVVFGAAWCWAFPLVIGLAGLAFLFNRGWVVGGWLVRLLPLWIVTTAWLAQPAGPLAPAEAARWGGAPGFWIARGMHALVGLWGGRIFLTLALIVVLVLVLRRWLGWTAPLLGLAVGAVRGLVEGVGAVLRLGGRSLRAVVGGMVGGVARIGTGITSGLKGLGQRLHRGEASPAPPEVESHDSDPDLQRERRLHNVNEAAAEAAAGSTAIGTSKGTSKMRAAATNAALAAPMASGTGSKSPAPRGTAVRAPVKQVSGPVVLPKLDLLTEPDPTANIATPAALDAAADMLEDTLRSFGVEGEVKDVRPGPVVTTYEYQPAAGIRVNQIVQRADDLALAMKARSIRMEAPIPGKAAVGIEIPNPTAQLVRLKEVLRLTRDVQRQPLSVVLGKDVVGQAITVDLAALPHLLVAGSTGSGKSVCLNSIICNLLLNNKPSRVRLLLIDPKMLELNVYNGVPHLLCPVITDPKEALRSLKWMVAQMDLRYRQLAAWSVRNIDQFNDKIAAGEITDAEGAIVTEPMPFYVTIVDELADLMIQLGQDFELPITRLAQKARAVGIHLILATQRPSVNVLTGVIKANIPCRIAFRVIQKNDSRTILDMNGAEQLLGHGDMLYLQPGRALPIRVHGAFIDVDECEAITTHWRQFSGTTEEISLEESTTGGGIHTGEDDLYEDARRIVVLHQSGSTSLLQRRLRVGYTRAGRLMDMLEEAGVVGPFTGSKARDVLIKTDDLPDFEGTEGSG
jgi:hypothetical protein